MPNNKIPIVAAILIFSLFSCKKEQKKSPACQHSTKITNDAICQLKAGSYLFHVHVSYYPIGHLHPTPTPQDHDLPDTYLSVAFNSNDIITAGNYRFQYTSDDTLAKQMSFENVDLSQSSIGTSSFTYNYKTSAMHFYVADESAGYGTVTGYSTQ